MTTINSQNYDLYFNSSKKNKNGYDYNNINIPQNNNQNNTHNNIDQNNIDYDNNNNNNPQNNN